MKKNVCLLVLLLTVQQIISQNKASVEKSIYGIQTGTLGIWLNNESRLANEISLRTEIGFDAGIFGCDLHDGTGFVLVPVISLEPRWYYNLEKRNLKNKKTKNNTANFLTIGISYHPDWFVISNTSGLNVINQISIIPKWGIRRTIGNHFTYETGIGLGHRFYLQSFANKRGETALDLHLRIGYTF